MVTPRSPLLQGGVERHVAEVSRRLVAAGNEVEVLCGEPGGPAERVEERDGVTIRSVRAHPAGRDWFWAPRIWRAMGRQRWDLVHVQSYHTLVPPLAMLRALTLRTPYVLTFHGGGHTLGFRNRARRLQRQLLRPLLARAARLVAVARFEVEEYGRELRLPAERFALIPNGTDVSFSAAAPIRDGAPTVASIGRLERYKGHHRALAAFPDVLRARPETRMLIVGSGPYGEELRAQAAALGIAESVDFTSVPATEPGAMAELMRRVWVMVLLSEFETHPIVALEGAAAGCRLLVADQGGLAELAADGFARAVPLEEEPARVAAAVLEELSQPPQQHRPSVISWEECTDRLLELYRSVAQT